VKTKFVFAIVVIIASVTILLYNSKNEVIFNSRTYTIEDGEYGPEAVMRDDREYENSKNGRGEVNLKEYNKKDSDVSLTNTKNKGKLWKNKQKKKKK
tara:strand:+ start:77 stop:367 length:291 start_codon:yes stop_codon:yes gene_type:complete